MGSCRKRCLHSAPASRHQPRARPHHRHLWPLRPRSGPRVSLPWGWPGGQGCGPNHPRKSYVPGYPRRDLGGLPAASVRPPTPAQHWAPGPPDGMPACSPPTSPPRLQGTPEPPSNETQAGLTERPGFLLTPSSHCQPHVHQGHSGDADDSSVLRARSPSKCYARAGAFSCLTDRCRPWPLGRPGQGPGGRVSGWTGPQWRHPFTPPYRIPPHAPPPADASRSGTQLARLGAPHSVLLKNRFSLIKAALARQPSSGWAVGDPQGCLPSDRVFRAAPHALFPSLCSPQSGSGTIPPAVCAYARAAWISSAPARPTSPWQVPQICPPGRASRERWDPGLLARVAEGLWEGTSPGNTRAPILPVPRIICGRVANSPRGSMTDLS